MRITVVQFLEGLSEFRVSVTYVTVTLQFQHQVLMLCSRLHVGLFLIHGTCMQLKLGLLTSISYVPKTPCLFPSFMP